MAGKKEDKKKVGCMGPRGPQGAAGQRGPEGLQGRDGPIGPVGPEGPEGPAGKDGLNGLNGGIGPQGPIGPEGPAGQQGVRGNQGPRGATGDQGPAGPRGFKGATGEAGPQGPEGPQGIQGETGARGQRGLTGPEATLLDGGSNIVTGSTLRALLDKDGEAIDVINGRFLDLSKLDNPGNLLADIGCTDGVIEALHCDGARTLFRPRTIVYADSYSSLVLPTITQNTPNLTVVSPEEGVTFTLGPLGGDFTVQMYFGNQLNGDGDGSWSATPQVSIDGGVTWVNTSTGGSDVIRGAEHGESGHWDFRHFGNRSAGDYDVRWRMFSNSQSLGAGRSVSQNSANLYVTVQEFACRKFT